MNDLLKKKCLCNLDSNNHCQECNLMKKSIKKCSIGKLYISHYIQQIQVKGFFVSLEFEDICLQNQNSTNRHFSKITWRINIIIPKYIDNRKKQECLLDTKRD